MNIEQERRLIIEEICRVNEEWKLKAIKGILNMDVEDDIPLEEEDEEIPEDLDDFKSRDVATVSWDDIQEKISREK